MRERETDKTSQDPQSKDIEAEDLPVEESDADEVKGGINKIGPGILV